MFLVHQQVLLAEGDGGGVPDLVVYVQVCSLVGGDGGEAQGQGQSGQPGCQGLAGVEYHGVPRSLGRG